MGGHRYQRISKSWRNWMTDHAMRGLNLRNKNLAIALSSLLVVLMACQSLATRDQAPMDPMVANSQPGPRYLPARRVPLPVTVSQVLQSGIAAPYRKGWNP